jgi:hypothetical protein
MAIFDPKNIPVISKLTIGEKTYYLKDAEARELLKTLGTAAKKDVAAGVSADEQGLVTGAMVQAAIAGISGSMHFRGVFASTAEVTDPAAGDVIIVGVKEYVYGGDPADWHELGDETLYALKTVTIGTQNLSANINLDTLAADMGLGALAKKDSATGTVAGQTIKGLKAKGNAAGSIAVELTQTSTAATLTKSDYTPSGDVSGSVTAAGTVSIAKDADNGTQISGSVSAPTVTVTPATDTIKKVTSVGTLPTKAADTFTPNGDDTFTAGSQAAWSANVDDASETLSFSFPPPPILCLPLLRGLKLLIPKVHLMRVRFLSWLLLALKLLLVLPVLLLLLPYLLVISLLLPSLVLLLILPLPLLVKRLLSFLALTMIRPALMLKRPSLLRERLSLM